MKIIKNGDLSQVMQTKRFVCDVCGCEFEADKGEYRSGSQYNKTYFTCTCPCCYKTANEDLRAFVSVECVPIITPKKSRKYFR